MNGEEPPAVHHVGIGAGTEQALGHVNEPAEGRLVKNRVLVLLQKDGLNKFRS